MSLPRLSLAIALALLTRGAVASATERPALSVFSNKVMPQAPIPTVPQNNPTCSKLADTYDLTCELGSTIDSTTNPTGYGQLNLNSNWEYAGPQWRCYVSVPAENDDLTALATFYGVSGGLSSAAPGAATLGYFPTNNAAAAAANLYLYTNGTAYPGATVNVCNNTLQSVGGNNASCNVGIQTPADQIESVYYYTYDTTAWNALVSVWCQDKYFVGSQGYQAISNLVNQQSSAYGYPIQSVYAASAYPGLATNGTGSNPFGYSALLGAGFSSVDGQPSLTGNPVSSLAAAGTYVLARANLLCCRRPI